MEKVADLFKDLEAILDPGRTGTAASAVLHESERLAALAQYDILDTPREKAFDQLAQLAADICETPIALVCFVAEHRQWFKAAIGLDYRETPITEAICAHAIRQDDIFTVPDLTKDDRFYHSSMVTAAPHARFYAGMPLTTQDGLRLGTLCVLDTLPRPDGLDERQRRMLRTLADQVMSQLELRRVARERDRRDVQLRQLSRQLIQAQRIAKLGGWHWQVSTQKCYWSDEVYRITGRDPARFDVTFEAMLACIHPDDRAQARAALEAAVRENAGRAHEFRFVREDGEIRYCFIEARPIVDERGTVVALAGICQDVTERRRAADALRESEEHYRYTVEINPQMSWTTDPSGAILTINNRWLETTGLTREQLLGKAWLEQVHPDDDATVREAVATSIATGEPLDIRYRLRLGSGEHRYVRSRALPRRDEQGRIIRWYGSSEDVHDSVLAEQALRASEERLRLAVGVTGIGIWDYDAATGTRRWSDELRTILGFGPDTPADLDLALSLVHPDDRDTIDAWLRRAHAPDGGMDSEVAFRIARANDGAWRWIVAYGHKILDESGAVGRIIMSLRDVTEQRTAEERILWTATHDPLTRLPNRALFQDQLDKAIRRAAKKGDCLGLLLLDVDHFKRINDTLGHDAGDAVLQTFADRLRTVVRPSDVVARFGGDEFAIILSSVKSEADVAATVEAILARLREPFIHDGRILDCRASIGASLYPDHTGDAADLIKDADIALYIAKSAGRGGFSIFQPAMRADMQRRASMISMARDALETGCVTPYYQPKVELSTGKLTGFEALMRWTHPRLGLQLPGTISAAFEDLELAASISDRMFATVLGDMRRWLDQGLDFGQVAINASAAEFRRDGLAERVLEQLHRAGIDPQRLEIEVTETVFLGRGAEYVDRALKLLSGEGVRIALDDFGTGYASLSHLKQFPVDIIKIDQSFVRNLEQDADDAAIIKAVLNLGQSLGVKTVAEGIETPMQAAYLWAQGCNQGQGHLFGMPVAAPDIPALIGSWVATRRWMSVGPS